MCIRDSCHTVTPTSPPPVAVLGTVRRDGREQLDSWAVSRSVVVHVAARVVPGRLRGDGLPDLVQPWFEPVAQGVGLMVVGQRTACWCFDVRPEPGPVRVCFGALSGDPAGGWVLNGGRRGLMDPASQLRTGSASPAMRPSGRCWVRASTRSVSYTHLDQEGDDGLGVSHTRTVAVSVPSVSARRSQVLAAAVGLDAEVDDRVDPPVELGPPASRPGYRGAIGTSHAWPP